MALNLTLPPRPVATASSDPAAWSEGFQAGAAAERAKWVNAGALKGSEPVSAAKAKDEPEAVSWDEVAAETNARAGLSAPVREV